MKTAMIIASDAGARTAGIIREELGKEVDLFSVSERSGCVRIDSITDFTLRHFGDYEAFVFIGAMGICVRAIAPCVTSKYADPAVVNVDATGHFVVSVLAGHVGGANALTERLARILGAQPVVTTQSDNTGLWALDLLGKENGWKMEYRRSLNELISIFVNQRPTALLLDIRDEGTDRLEHSRQSHSPSVTYRRFTPDFLAISQLNRSAPLISPIDHIAFLSSIMALYPTSFPSIVYGKL